MRTVAGLAVIAAAAVPTVMTTQVAASAATAIGYGLIAAM